jgi:hypothetical protein
MKSSLFALTLTFLLYLPALNQTEKATNPLAPSLPLLTSEEEEKIDGILDRFIQYDMGLLRGEEGKKALTEFKELGPEAIPGLIRGLNRAAKIESSCPAVTIAKKLATMLRSSNDPLLLDFARENVGAGITQSRHMGVIKDLRWLCMVRKREVAKNPTAVRPAQREQTLGTLFAPDESTAANGKHPDDQLRKSLKELAARNDDRSLTELAKAAASSEGEARQLARDLLSRSLSKRSSDDLKAKLTDEQPEIRAAAARIVGNKKLPHGEELIDLLSDDAAEVRQAAHQALVRLSRGKDFGPKPDAKESARTEAIQKWRDWWAKQASR